MLRGSPVWDLSRMVDINQLSAAELRALIKAAELRQAQLKRKPLAKVRAMILAAARQAGYTVDELFGAAAIPGTRRRRRKGKPSKVPPKYRNPENPDQTWSGRGMMPKWLAALTKRGRSRADFLIPGIAKPTPSKHRPDGRRRLIKATPGG